MQVFDSYADVNGTWWGLCEEEDLSASVSITSYFNSLRVRQSSDTIGVTLNATVSTIIGNACNTPSPTNQPISQPILFPYELSLPEIYSERPVVMRGVHIVGRSFCETESDLPTTYI